jgi:hypothetical protein
MKKIVLFLMLMTIWVLSSCSSASFLEVSGVGYQTLQMQESNKDFSEQAIKKAQILVFCLVDKNGDVEVMVENNTDQIMTIDRTKSFFQNQNDVAQMYYDPTIHTNTQSVTLGSTTGIGVNLGSVARAVGVGGILGTALSGVNVGGGNSTSTTNVNTTYTVDQPKVSIPPHGRISMGRMFPMLGVGRNFLHAAVTESPTDINNLFVQDNTYARANICISFSIDGEKSFQFIETHLYANSLMIGKVNGEGYVNNALRTIYTNNPNALLQPWYLLYFASAKKNRDNNCKISQQIFVNYN